MPSTLEIRAKVRDFLDGRIPVQAFADWSAAYSWNIHKRTADGETQALAYAVRAIVVQHETQDIDDREMRVELESSIGSSSQPLGNVLAPLGRPSISSEVALHTGIALGAPRNTLEVFYWPHVSNNESMVAFRVPLTEISSPLSNTAAIGISGNMNVAVIPSKQSASATDSVPLREVYVA